MSLTLVPQAIEDYAAAHSDPVPELHRAIVETTHAETTLPRMLVGRIEGAFLRMLVKLCGAKRIVEVGTFTGYSALMMAEALPEDGRLTTCDVDEHHAALAQKHFAESPHGRKIELAFGPALDTLVKLPDGSVDLMFVDADKHNYPRYYEQAVRLLRSGGLLVGDNCLWSGKVLDPQDADTKGIVEFNGLVAADARFEKVLLTVRDGMMLARRR